MGVCEGRKGESCSGNKDHGSLDLLAAQNHPFLQRMRLSCVNRFIELQN